MLCWLELPLPSTWKMYIEVLAFFVATLVCCGAYYVPIVVDFLIIHDRFSESRSFSSRSGHVWNPLCISSVLIERYRDVSQLVPDNLCLSRLLRPANFNERTLDSSARALALLSVSTTSRAGSKGEAGKFLRVTVRSGDARVTHIFIRG